MTAQLKVAAESAAPLPDNVVIAWADSAARLAGALRSATDRNTLAKAAAAHARASAALLAEIGG